MDYKYIEALVRKAKDGDVHSKEQLAEEFKPFIINLANKTFIQGYDFYDLQNECYQSLFKCLSLYNIENHRFVGYATAGIKNNINDLIRKNIKRNPSEGCEVLTYDYSIIDSCIDDMNIEEIILSRIENAELRNALTLLSDSEKEMIDFIYFNNRPLAAYASLMNLKYSTVQKRKKRIFNKIQEYLMNKICYN